MCQVSISSFVREHGLNAHGHLQRVVITSISNASTDNSALYERGMLKANANLPWMEGALDLDVDPLAVAEMVHTFKNNGGNFP